MKKFTVLLLLLCACGLFAQQPEKDKFKSSFKAPETIIEQPGNPDVAAFGRKFLVPPQPVISEDSRYVNISPLGGSANAWGFAYQRNTFLWVDNNVNSISFMHRMNENPGSGYLAYDASFDGGQSWTVNNQVYDPTLPDAYNARYPQGVLYNPQGNTDPQNSYFSYFAPTLDGSNSSGDATWGGYCWGTKKFANGSQPTQNNQTSSEEIKQFLPPAFTLTQTGETWMVDEENEDVAGTYIYTGNLIVGHGLWNSDQEEFEYEFSEIELEILEDDVPNDLKIAFSPDGQTGWICVMSELPDQLPYTSYHPIFFKSTDGGESWSGPIEVQLGGYYGLEAVKQFISDEKLQEFYDPDPVPPRDQVNYYMGYHIDLSVDSYGNPHIVGVIALADPDGSGWYNYEGVFGMFHVWSNDQGTNWKSFLLDYLVTFDKEWTGSNGSALTMDNRPQSSSTPDGAIIFFSWVDTRIEDVVDNESPDIYFREFIPITEEHGPEVINVTAMSAAMWQAHDACMPHYVFTEMNADGNYQCTIPFVYEELPNLDVSSPVQFWYIPNFKKSYMIIITDEEELPAETLVSVFPNPAGDIANFNLNLSGSCPVRIEIYSLTGQLIREYEFGDLISGPHQLRVNLEELTNGVYFYKTYAGLSSFTGKIVAQ